MNNSEEVVQGLLNKLPLLKKEIQKVIVGQDAVLDEILIALLAGGHCLLEGVPGLAKTLMVKSISQALDLSFRRIQFTPDLMPADIIGTEILEEDHSTGKRFFKFNKGPLFANMMLADEINRTPPKTQSALLEAMQEFRLPMRVRPIRWTNPFLFLPRKTLLNRRVPIHCPKRSPIVFLLYITIDYPSAAGRSRHINNTTGTKKPVINAVINASRNKAVCRNWYAKYPSMKPWCNM